MNRKQTTEDRALRGPQPDVDGAPGRDPEQAALPPRGPSRRRDPGQGRRRAEHGGLRARHGLRADGDGVRDAPQDRRGPAAPRRGDVRRLQRMRREHLRDAAEGVALREPLPRLPGAGGGVAGRAQRAPVALLRGCAARVAARASRQPEKARSWDAPRRVGSARGRHRARACRRRPRARCARSSRQRRRARAPDRSRRPSPRPPRLTAAAASFRGRPHRGAASRPSFVRRDTKGQTRPL